MMAAPTCRSYRDGDCRSVSFIDDCRGAPCEAWRRSVVDCGVRHCREAQANALGRRRTRFAAVVRQPHPHAG